MPRVAESICSLLQNRIARYEPEHDRALGLKQFRHCQSARVARQKCFAATRGDAQTHVRHVGFKAACSDWNVGKNLAAISFQRSLKRSAGTPFPGTLPQEISERVQNPLLIIFEGDHSIQLILIS
jgi:hypothetical protein